MTDRRPHSQRRSPTGATARHHRFPELIGHQTLNHRMPAQTDRQRGGLTSPATDVTCPLLRTSQPGDSQPSEPHPNRSPAWRSAFRSPTTSTSTSPALGATMRQSASPSSPLACRPSPPSSMWCSRAVKSVGVMVPWYQGVKSTECAPCVEQRLIEGVAADASPHNPACLPLPRRSPAADHPVWGVGCGASGVGRRVWGVGCGASGVGRRVWGVGCGASGVGRHGPRTGRALSWL
ncbi:hypothetical protein FHR33_006033 [Nonomuraea dietziae]|uniref:Uncharacterized protein n=1 Tax=Nonomuraea dietziae TaxID=65515 RepID=A0A7W5Y9X0_9ACTN|nr:hypothetical protein [Nonomuraea dietziae]